MYESLCHLTQSVFCCLCLVSNGIAAETAPISNADERDGSAMVQLPLVPSPLGGMAPAAQPQVASKTPDQGGNVPLSPVPANVRLSPVSSGLLTTPASPDPAALPATRPDSKTLSDAAPLKRLSDLLGPAGTTPPTDEPSIETAALSKSATWGVLTLAGCALFMLAFGRNRA